MTYARDHLYERGAVHARKDILAAALDRSMGQAMPASTQVRKEFERRVETGEFRLVENIGTGPHLGRALQRRRRTALRARFERNSRPHPQVKGRAELRRSRRNMQEHAGRPDNRSRTEINQAIHAEMQAKGIVGQGAFRPRARSPRTLPARTAP